MLFLTETDQKDLAQQVGLNETSISKRVTGQQKWTVGELVSLADVFDLPVSSLLGDPRRLLAENSERFAPASPREVPRPPPYRGLPYSPAA